MDNPRTVLALYDLVYRFGPKIVFLNWVEKRWEESEGVNHGGGLVLLKKERDLVTLIGYYIPCSSLGCLSLFLKFFYKCVNKSRVSDDYGIGHPTETVLLQKILALKLI